MVGMAVLFAAALFCSQVSGQVSRPSDFGNYPDTAVTIGANATVIPDMIPAGVRSMNVSTDTRFKGSFAANWETGDVHVTNAHPAGTYTIKLKGFFTGGTTTQTFTLTVLSGTECGGTFQFTSAPDVGMGASSNPNSVAIGDFNNDGKQDLATANQALAVVGIRLGNGAGGFSAMPDVSVGTFTRMDAIADFNNDGNQDLAVASQFTDSISIRLGDGTGNFSGTTNVSVQSSPLSVAVGDFNSDGKMDIAAGNINSNSVSIRLGNGAGGFSGSNNESVGSQPINVAIGDFNNDGVPDLATANFNANTVSIRIGNGSGGF